MIVRDFIYSEVERVLRKYKTRDPYELLDAIGAVTQFSTAYSADGLKGYCTVLHRIPYAVINGNLDDADKKIAAGHEAAHLIIHRKQIMSSPVKAMRDFNLYDNSGLVESEANFFLADFIASDKDVLDVIESSYDYFSAARELCIPAPLLAFKLYSMMRRGYEVRNPADLDSKFLGVK
jgi:Zn-dependent peptidase ImmA (M78 family)